MQIYIIAVAMSIGGHGRKRREKENKTSPGHKT
jgi:hypothetical protein